MEPPPPKRMRTNGQGREEAVVLTSSEQRTAARARMLLRQQQGDMQKAINAAQQNSRVADRAFQADLKKIEAVITKVQKEGEKAQLAERKAAGCIPVGDKKQAAAASALQDGKQALSVARQSLLKDSRLQEELKKKKAELQKLRDTAYAVAVEDDNELQDENDEGEEEETNGDPNLASLADVEAMFEILQEEASRVHTLADRAAADALVAVATSVLVKAAKKQQKRADVAAAARASAAARPSAPLQYVTNNVS